MPNSVCWWRTSRSHSLHCNKCCSSYQHEPHKSVANVNKIYFNDFICTLTSSNNYFITYVFRSIFGLPKCCASRTFLLARADGFAAVLRKIVAYSYIQQRVLDSRYLLIALRPLYIRVATRPYCAI